MSNGTRAYTVDARSTGTHGRVHVHCRQHHLIVDGPVENGCPGEALTPAELFLAGIASCGVELIEVLAHHEDIPLQDVAASIEGTIDRTNPVREDVTVFNSVRLALELVGVDDQQAKMLVEAFKVADRSTARSQLRPRTSPSNGAAAPRRPLH